MDTVIKIWCEWDCGQDYLVFKNDEDARLWCEQNPYMSSVETGVDGGVDGLLEEGLLQFQEIDVWTH